jgi:hypothetical protein
VVVHSHKECLRDRETGSGTDHRIDSAFWAESGLAFINPLRNLGGRECGKPVKASTKRTPLYFGAV